MIVAIYLLSCSQLYHVWDRTACEMYSNWYYVGDSVVQGENDVRHDAGQDDAIAAVERVKEAGTVPWQACCKGLVVFEQWCVVVIDESWLQ